MLADEPTGSLDEENSYKIIGLLKLLNKKGKTIVIVTHDKNIANECNRIINI
ncbi:recombinase XerC [Clostridium botulinum]|nr:recombinase XerC [Clostridium botulinum]MBN3361381.1 recombinase XerC [Clostridium botulinum]NFM44630.1 recombinase XerC [Clostridium botulinum]